MGPSAARVAVLSLHPEYAEGILTGAKTVEFRRRSFARPVERILIYATLPVQRLLGEFCVGEIHEAEPAQLWERHGGDGLIDRAAFDSYYRGANRGTAIRVASVRRYAQPLELAILGDVRPPQNFVYVGLDALQAVEDRRPLVMRELGRAFGALLVAARGQRPAAATLSSLHSLLRGNRY